MLAHDHLALDTVRLDPSNSGIIEGVKKESWEYSDADTQHLTHNIHRYSGKFIPQIAGRAISLLTNPGEFVVDPYCGSGTTLVEAVLLGRKVLGVDLNPLATLIARAKTTQVSSTDLASLQEELALALEPLNAAEELPLFRNSLKTSAACHHSQDEEFSKDPWFRKWFQPRILNDLIAINRAILAVEDTRKQSIARVAFSDILRRSSNAHSGYPNVMFDKNALERPSPVKPFLNSLARICEMVASLDKTGACWQNARVELGSATALPVEDCSVHAIISHPPYIGSIPYAEYGVLSLKWLGVDPKRLDQQLTGGRRQSSNVVERFREEYGKMLIEAGRVLRPGRYMFLMVGNPLVRGEPIDLATMTIDLAERAGFFLVVRSERAGINRRANKMGAEHLLFFEKALVSQAGSVKDATAAIGHRQKVSHHH
jgi:SAM-dependent methyltransferase